VVPEKLFWVNCQGLPAGALMPVYVPAQEWPEAVVPWTPLGKMMLNENIKNFHNEVLPLSVSCCARYSCSIWVRRRILH
jgi:hypothetical protein